MRFVLPSRFTDFKRAEELFLMANHLVSAKAAFTISSHLRELCEGWSVFRKLTSSFFSLAETVLANQLSTRVKSALCFSSKCLKTGYSE